MPTTPAHLLVDLVELLHRQVHPSFIRDGRPTSAAFRPTPKDGGELSVSRGSILSPQEAHQAYVASGPASAGVWSVSVGEVEAAGLHAYEDKLPDAPAHAVIDFKPLASNGMRDRTADLLKRAALARCVLFQPEAPSEQPVIVVPKLQSIDDPKAPAEGSPIEPPIHTRNRPPT